MNASRASKVSLRVVAGLALAILAIFLFAWIAEEVLENDTSRFDTYVRTQAHTIASPTLTSVMKFVTLVGSPVPVILLTVLAVVLFWYRRHAPSAVILIITVAGAGILEYVLKLAFHRARPVPYFDIPAPQSLSFPSGHALGAFCFYGMLAHLLVKLTRRRAVHGVFWAIAIFMMLIIGFSRIYLGVHYPSDVLAGYAAGAVWLIAMILAEREFTRWRRSRRAREEVLKHV